MRSAPKDTKQGAEEKLILDDIGIVDNEEAALKCARVVLEQSQRFLSSTEGWSIVQAPKCDGVKLESKMPSGKSLPVVRSEGRVECSAGALYDLLTSNEGYRLLNPSADPEQFNKPFLGPFSLEAKDGADGSGASTTQRSRIAQLERATMKMPATSNREFVTVNIKDGANLTMVACSVLSPAYPGGSSHQSEMTVLRGWRLVRGAITATYSCSPIPGEENACIFRVWQWLDIGGWVGAAVNRMANVYWFPPAYQRIRDYVTGKKVDLTPGSEFKNLGK